MCHWMEGWDQDVQDAEAAELAAILAEEALLEEQALAEDVFLADYVERQMAA